MDEFSLNKDYSVDCVESRNAFDTIEQRVWVSKKEYLLIEVLNFNENIIKILDNYDHLTHPQLYYQSFLNDDGTIKNEAYKLRIKFKKKHTLYALSLVCVMLLCSDVENDDDLGVKIYLNNKMLPIFSEYDIAIPERKNYSQLGAEDLHVHKDIDYEVNLIVNEIKEENEFYITGADVYSI